MTDDGKKLASWSVKKVEGVGVVEVGLEEFGMDSGTDTDMCVEMIGLAPGLARAACRYYYRKEDLLVALGVVKEGEGDEGERTHLQFVDISRYDAGWWLVALGAVPGCCGEGR